MSQDVITRDAATEEADTADEIEQQPDAAEVEVEQDVELEGGEDAEGQEDDEPDADAETFSRTYVEKLRRENQRYRDRAGEADELAQRLHTALVAATGRLADPSDLDFDAAHLDDPDALAAAVDELLTKKPHLASRRPLGDIGQGATRTSETVDLAGILRSRA